MTMTPTRTSSITNGAAGTDATSLTTPALTSTPALPPAHLHHAFETRTRQLVVTRIVELTSHIKHFVFADPDGRALTGYEPGSHIIIETGAGTGAETGAATSGPEAADASPAEASAAKTARNTYSLVGDGINPRQYEISVLRSGAGAGSDWLHDTLEVGSTVTIEGPRSMFSPDPVSKKLLLVAAGIGVTPILSHARAAARWGRKAEVIYIHRPGFGAHLDELRQLADDGSIELYEAHSRDAGTALLRQRLRSQPLGTHAYACGPMAMLDNYIELGQEAGWPHERLHLERFEVPEQDPGTEFTATIASTGHSITVPPGVSLLERLLESGYAVPNLCRQGVCGECLIPVKSGAIEHRDYVLGDKEKSSNTAMLCCVSRAEHGHEIEVDL